MNVLVDTSVWVAHFKRRDERLVALLEADRVVCHPYVVIEVACGTPPQRHLVIETLAALDRAPLATHDELLALITRRGLHGRGCGLVDLGLLASALLAGQTLLWTLDKRLATLAGELGCTLQPALAS
jgi:predicted nucleic acid-binding protein